MNAVRLGLLLAATTTILGTAACSTTTKTDTTPSTSPVAASQTPTQPDDVDAGIITALTATTVTWTDGQIVPTDAGPGYTIHKLTGTNHQHTATLATDLKLYLPFDTNGIVHLDKDNLGTIACPTTTAFKTHVLNNTQTAPRISFNTQGQVTKMAARYQS